MTASSDPDRPVVPGEHGRRGEVRLDLLRADRIGLDEALLCAGKSVGQIATIIDEIVAAKTSMLLTRLSTEVFESLPASQQALLDFEALSRTAVLGPPKPERTNGLVGVVTAGTSDLPVSREAVRTLSYLGHVPMEISDVGVAGLWRLTERLEDIRKPLVIIAVAGMDAALVSVLGGLLAGVVIAVPTSTGYGVARNGETALAASLTSCSPGVTVVNIDNGYGAACAAVRVLNLLARERQLTNTA